jgi:hypothetical protein
MSEKEILEALKRLTPSERLIVIEGALEELRRELQQAESPPDKEGRKKQLASAAEVLLADYASDAELTAFSILDGEDFHA